MNFFDVLESRHSIRKFKDETIEEKHLAAILNAMNSAPSAGDLQAYEVVLVKDKKRKKRLAKAAYGQEFIAEAPINIIFLANPKKSSMRYGERGVRLYCIQDATIAASYAQLAAAALGLGSVWVGAFDEDAVAKTVNAGDSIPIAIIPVGHPDEEPYSTPRRNLEGLVHYEEV